MENKSVPVLVIGSTVVDVLIHLPRLPGKGDDINIDASSLRLGGCAFNVAQTLESFGVPHLLCSPVGSGVYGDYVAEKFECMGRQPFIRLDEDNGCCYCLIEPNGERTFLSHHGAEYRFYRRWMEGVNLAGVNSVFICGLEVEESTGEEVIEFVCSHPELTLFFAPGPRIMHIQSSRMDRLLDRHPVLHMNRREAKDFTGASRVEEAAAALGRRTGQPVVITCGSEGAFCLAEGKGEFCPTQPVLTVNTTGAGDAHCGALIARLTQGCRFCQAMVDANRAGANAASGLSPGFM